MSYCFPIFEQWSIPNWGEILFPIEKKDESFTPKFYLQESFCPNEASGASGPEASGPKLIS